MTNQYCILSTLVNLPDVSPYLLIFSYGDRHNYVYVIVQSYFALFYFERVMFLCLKAC